MKLVTLHFMSTAKLVLGSVNTAIVLSNATNPDSACLWLVGKQSIISNIKQSEWQRGLELAVHNEIQSGQSSTGLGTRAPYCKENVDKSFKHTLLIQKRLGPVFIECDLSSYLWSHLAYLMLLQTEATILTL